ncbi:MAG: cell division protein ZapA [Alphaproteobacteria bacterium]|nr:cell division protein ZapA [Alphaproteobacteria bacterium]
MAKVNIIIGGQSYTFACGDGQEVKLQKIASLLNEKVLMIKNGHLMNDSMALVMGALIAIGELSDKCDELILNQEKNMLSQEDVENTVNSIEKASNQISNLALIIENA